MAAGTVTFEPDAWDDFLYWLKQDIKTAKKIAELIKGIQSDPYNGIGKPEPLKYSARAGYWSRRINQIDRLVYQINGEVINIMSCRHHYTKH